MFMSNKISESESEVKCIDHSVTLSIISGNS